MHEMLLVAPDRFEGALRAPQVAAAIGRGLERAGWRPPDLCPVASGGAGTIEALLTALGGEVVGVGDVSFALLDDGDTALVETDVDGEAHELVGAAAQAGARVIVLAGRARAPGAEAGARAPGARASARIVRATAPLVLDLLGFDDRMRAARAVITGEGRLDAGTLRGRVVGEIGTRTRQGGVPLHAIVGTDALDPFAKRMIDLQRVLEAPTLEALEAAGELLGAELGDGRA